MIQFNFDKSSSFVISESENPFNPGNKFSYTFLDVDLLKEVFSKCSIFAVRNAQLTCKTLNFAAKKYYRSIEIPRLTKIIASAEQIDNARVRELIHSCKTLIDKYQDSLIIDFKTSSTLLTRIIEIQKDKKTPISNEDIDSTLKNIYGNQIFINYDQTFSISEKFAIESLKTEPTINEFNTKSYVNYLLNHTGYINVLKIIRLFASKSFNQKVSILILKDAFAKSTLPKSQFSKISDDYITILSRLRKRKYQLDYERNYYEFMDLDVVPQAHGDAEKNIENSLVTLEMKIISSIHELEKNHFIQSLEFFGKYSLPLDFSFSIIEEVVKPLTTVFKTLKNIEETKLEYSIENDNPNQETRLKIESLLNLLIARLNIDTEFNNDEKGIVGFYYSKIITKINECKTTDEACKVLISFKETLPHSNLKINFLEEFKTGNLRFEENLAYNLKILIRIIIEFNKSFKEKIRESLQIRQSLTDEDLLVDNQDRLVIMQTYLEIKNPKCREVFKQLITIFQSKNTDELLSKMEMSEKNHDGFNEALLELLLNEIPGFFNRAQFHELAIKIYSSILKLYTEKNVIKAKEIILSIDKVILLNVIGKVNMQRLWPCFEDAINNLTLKNILDKQFITNYKIKITEKLLHELIISEELLDYLDVRIDSPFRNFHMQILNLFEQFPDFLYRYSMSENELKNIYSSIFKLLESKKYPNKLHVKKLIIDQIKNDYLKTYFTNFSVEN